MENWTNLDKGREGVKNPGNFADVICTWPLGTSTIFEDFLFNKGACTNDVSREGEGGGYPNSDGRRGRLRDLYSKNSDKGGRGSKIPKI